jgi:hypothetical protein
MSVSCCLACNYQNGKEQNSSIKEKYKCRDSLRRLTQVVQERKYSYLSGLLICGKIINILICGDVIDLLQKRVTYL